MTIQQGIIAPRFHHQWLSDRIEYEIGAFSEDTITRLKNLGHSLVGTERIGNTQGIVIDTSTELLETGPDPRKSSVANTIVTVAFG
jgi:gamma-glutamyltranspeptidase/glutathione hydrolase